MDLITLAIAKKIAQGGGTGGGVLVVTETEYQGEPLVSGTLPNVAGYRYTQSHGEGSLYLTVTGLGETVNVDALVVTVGTTTYSGNKLAVGSVDNELRVYLTEEQSSESAIAGLQITVVVSYIALDNTWQEIHDAMLSGGACVQYSDEHSEIIQACDNAGDAYWIATLSNNYMSPTADGYPSFN